MKVQVIEDSIKNVQADALLTAINSGRFWLGRIDSVIGSCAGQQFHSQALRALEADQSVKVIVAPKQYGHEGKFDHVVFSIDDLDESLKDVVLRGLDTAAAAGYRSVSLPAIRLGVTKNAGGSQTHKVHEIVAAIQHHELNITDTLDELTVVIYDDPRLAREFEHELAKAFGRL